MSQIQRTIIITYRWWNDDLKTPISRGHGEALEETAMELIGAYLKDGITDGELNDNIRMYDKDGDEGIPYKGRFEMTTIKVSV